MQEKMKKNVFFLYNSEKATSIMWVKLFWRSSAVVASPVRILSETVQITSALLPLRAAFI